jgi:hypothetical protein
MPQHRQILKVFLASPSDVADERDLVAEIVQELNESVGRMNGVMLELIRWETQAIPGVGADAQDRINRSMDADCDVFIGVFWTRIGTPTFRAESGSIEEYNRARSRLDAGEDVEIMLYFKQATVDLESIDLTQLSNLRAFKAKLAESGVLYSTFGDGDDFSRKLRAHLTFQITRLASTESQLSQLVRKQDPVAPQEDSAHSAQDDELGMMELQEILEEEFPTLNSTILRVSSATGAIGDQIRAHTAEIERLVGDARGVTVDRKQAKAIISRASMDMLTFASQLELEVPLYKKSFDRTFGAISSYYSLQNDVSERIESDKSLLALRTPLSMALEQTETFRDTVRSLPRMTSDINKARRAVVAALDKWISELRNSLVLLESIERSN